MLLMHSLKVRMRFGRGGMATVTNFFLGANSGGGFHNLFPQLTADNDTYDLMILKGCPGNGKSSFMRRIGTALEAAGADVEYIEFAGCTHNSWNPAFNYPDFMKWLFKQRSH